MGVRAGTLTSQAATGLRICTNNRFGWWPSVQGQTYRSRKKVYALLRIVRSGPSLQPTVDVVNANQTTVGLEYKLHVVLVRDPGVLRTDRGRSSSTFWWPVWRKDQILADQG
jgi:hypothetical protein